MAVKAVKRKSGTSDSIHTKKKKRPNPKTTVTSTGDSKFDFKLFRKELSSSQGNTVSLNQFLKLLKLDPNNVHAYIQAGGNSGEILRQINDEHRKNPLVIGLVFNTLQIMFDKIIADLPLQKQEAEDTCRYFLNTFMSTIDFMLSDKNNDQEQVVTLNLLTSIVNLNFELGLLVLNQVNFQPRLISHLAKFRHSKNEGNVRSSFVVFIMSFFAEGNSSLIKSLVEKQGVLSLLINDLVKDSADVVLNVINTLKKHIVENTNISKTNKIKVFNSDVIAQVFNLFNWKCKSKDADDDTSKSEINEATGNLLFQLCTSHKLGIYFTDATLGTSEVHNSQHLWKAFESLQAPWNNEVARELILKILFQCPDLHGSVLNVIQESFIVRNSEQWLRTVIFLKELITLFSNDNLTTTVSQLNTTQICTFIKNVFLPSGILTKSTDALKSTDYAIKNEIILLLTKMLQAVKSCIDLFTELNISNRNSIKIRIQDFISKLFPNVDYLVSLMHLAMDNKKFQSNAMETDTIKIAMPTNTEFVLNILDFVLIYDEIIPESLDPISTTLDSKRMLEKVNKMDIDDKEKLMLKITKFLLSADKFAFAPGKPLFHEILNTMFVVYLSSDETLSLEARSVLQEILVTTGIFEKNIEEVDILLQIIQDIGTTDDKITNMFINLIEEINQKTDVYKSNLDSLELNSNTQKECKINLDEVFENLNEAENQKYDTVFIPEKPSLTEFFIGILNFIPKEKSDNFDLLKNKYLINLFHIQENPEKFLKIISEFKMDDNLKKYITKWTENPTNVSSKIYCKSSLLFRLSKNMLSDEQLNPDDYFVESSMNTTEAIAIFNMTLFYMLSMASLEKFLDSKAANCETVITKLLDLSLTKFESKPLYIKFLKKLLSHNVPLSSFQPFPNKNIEKNTFITKIVLKFIKLHKENNIDQSNINYYLLPYKQKIFSSLQQHIKKCGKSKKGMNFPNIEVILSTVSLHKPNVPNLVHKIVNLNVTCMIDEESGVSSWLKILYLSINLYTEWNETFSLELFKKISMFYSKLILELEITINLAEFEEALFKYLIRNPEFISSVPYSVFESIFNIKHINKSTVKLACLILKFNENVLPKFIKIVKNSENMEKRELVIPLLQSASQHIKFLSETELLQSIYSKYESAIQKIIEKPHKVAQLYIDNCSVVEFIIHNCMSVIDCQKVFKKVHKFETAEIFHINILEAVYLKAVSTEESQEKVFTVQENYLLNILFLSSLALKREDVENSLIDRLSICLKSFLSSFEILIQSDDEKTRFHKIIIENSNWQNFIKSVLKQSLQTEKENKSSYALFEALSLLIDFLYTGNHDDIKNIFEMTTSHSEFLNVILNNQNQTVKLCLVKLLLVLLQKDTSVAKTVHIPIYLSAYHATRSKLDRVILKILNIYESSGISMGEYQPYLWGDTACNHYAVRIKRNRRTLWSNPTPNHVLNLLDKEIILNTVKYFSIKSSLEPNSDAKNSSLEISNDKIKDILHDLSISKNKNEKNARILQDKVQQLVDSSVIQKFKNDEFPIFELEESIENTIYDPSFLLPLLNFIMAPGSSVYTHRIVRGGVLAIPLIGLSSICPDIRAASYTVLHRFYALLEAEMFYKKDKLLWSGFLDSLRNSLNTAIRDSSEDENSTINLRLPAISSVYLAKSIFVMMHPLDPLFKPVNYFVIGKMSINFTVIPDFLDMFHNSDISYAERRIWILEIIRDGIKSFADVKVLLKSVAFKILFDFYNSCLAKDNVKILILEILNACILIPRVGKILREGYGLLSWLNYTCKKSNEDKTMLNSLLVKIISNLWYSFTSQCATKLENNKGKKSENPASLSEEIQQEIFFVLTDLLPKLSTLESSDKIVYLDVFRKICKSCIKSFDNEQILTLLKISTSNLNNDKYNSIMNNALKLKKRQFILPCNVLIEQYEKGTDEYKFTKYFYEIANKWLL